MKLFLMLTALIVFFSACEKSKSVVQTVVQGISENDKIRVVFAALDGHRFIPNGKIQKDECLLKYFSVDGTRDGDIIKATVRGDEGIGMLMVLTGGKTSESKWCEAFAKEVSKLRPVDKKELKIDLSVDMVTGKVLKTKK